MPKLLLYSNTNNFFQNYQISIFVYSIFAYFILIYSFYFSLLVLIKFMLIKIFKFYERLAFIIELARF